MSFNTHKRERALKLRRSEMAALEEGWRERWEGVAEALAQTSGTQASIAVQLSDLAERLLALEALQQACSPA